MGAVSAFKALHLTALRQGLSLNPIFTVQGILSGQRALEIHLQELQAHTAMPGFLQVLVVGAQILRLSQQERLPPEPSAQA